MHSSKAETKQPALYEVALKIHPVYHTLNPSNGNVLDQLEAIPALKDFINTLLFEAIPSTEGLLWHPWPLLTKMPPSVGATKNVLRFGQQFPGTNSPRLTITVYNSIERAQRQFFSWEKLLIP